MDSSLSYTEFHNVLLQRLQPEYSLSLYRTAVSRIIYKTHRTKTQLDPQKDVKSPGE